MMTTDINLSALGIPAGLQGQLTATPPPESTDETTACIVGWVQAQHTNRYDVCLNNGDAPYHCSVKATLKKAGITVLVGDVVWLDDIDATNQSARIVGVWPRHSQLPRPKMANSTHVLVVCALTQPEFDSEQLNRYLIHAAMAGLSVSIAFTKQDLQPDDSLLTRLRHTYADTLGYPVFSPVFDDANSYTPIADACRGQVSVLAGLSGAGKSSLLNRLNPSLGIEEGAVSHKLERGQHTTRHVALLTVAPGIIVADTPGFSRATFDEVQPDLVEQAFAEFARYRGECGFSNCMHILEDNCAVQAAVEAGKLSTERFDHYQRFMDEATEGEAARAAISDKTEYGQKKVSTQGGKQAARVRLNENLRGQSRRKQRQAMSQHRNQAVEDMDEEDGEW